ncbi:DUF86 domain-containing protein [Methanoregula sp.]|uniref:HepT-like ribonuclease domain-containing protein n=1 Tax=Methanoregula sp. TaxID=2052170 RepID=UPI003BAF66BD
MKDDRILLIHIHREIVFLTTISTGRKYEDLLSDEYYAHAVIRAVEVIGEAVKNLSAPLKERHPEIEWREIAGMRDKVIHRYFEINWQIVWNVINENLPAIEPKIADLIEETGAVSGTS